VVSELGLAPRRGKATADELLVCRARKAHGERGGDNLVEEEEEEEERSLPLAEERSRRRGRGGGKKKDSETHP
jgi:hypothetical protein